MTKTEQTRQAYLERGQLLWTRAARERGVQSQELSPLEFLDWLETLLPKLKPASRRQYISACRDWLTSFRENISRSGYDDCDLQAAIQKSQSMQSCHYSHHVDHRLAKIRKTSSQKLKRLDLEELRFITQKNINRKSRWLRLAVLWLTANTIVGLRPCEWRYVSLLTENRSVVLKVRNRKNTNGRSHGEYRHLILEGLGLAGVRLIARQIQEAKKYADNNSEWERYYNGVRKAIHRMMRENLGARQKYPSLYSSRHQFAADAKSSGLQKCEIAALMGHGKSETATSHYGKRKHGSGRCAVKPNEVEVRRVDSCGGLKGNKKSLMYEM